MKRRLPPLDPLLPISEERRAWLAKQGRKPKNRPAVAGSGKPPKTKGGPDA
jgi:hypothetical protein